MTRIEAKFDSLEHAGRKAFVGFLTAGDPSLERTLESALTLEAGGCDVL